MMAEKEPARDLAFGDLLLSSSSSRAGLSMQTAVLICRPKGSPTQSRRSQEREDRRLVLGLLAG